MKFISSKKKSFKTLSLVLNSALFVSSSSASFGQAPGFESNLLPEVKPQERKVISSVNQDIQAIKNAPTKNIAEQKLSVKEIIKNKKTVYVSSKAQLPAINNFDDSNGHFALQPDSPSPTVGQTTKNENKQQKIATKPVDQQGTLPSEIVLNITKDGDQITFNPTHLVFDKKNQIANLNFSGLFAHDKINVFARNPDAVEINLENLTVKSKKDDTTELFILINNQMHIIPITVGIPQVAQAATNAPEPLNVATELTKLPNLEKNVATAITEQTPQNGTQRVLENSKKKTLESLRRQAANQKTLELENKALVLADQIFQLIDDRSVPSKNIIYPINNVSLRIMGTDEIQQSDATGHLTFNQLPTNSRFLVAAVDSTRTYLPTMTEVSNLGEETQVHYVNMMRTITFENYAQVAGVSQHERNSSLCGTLFDKEGYALENAKISIDINAEGPFFFNQYGFLDPTFHKTGNNGRFCFFNIATGPYSLTFEKDNLKHLAALNSVASFHTEEEFHFDLNQNIETNVITLTSIQSQLDKNAKTYQNIDYSDLIPFGSEVPLEQVDFGTLASQSKFATFKDRVYLYSATAEFEPAVYSYNSHSQQHVTTLLPRGFVEDSALMANIAVQSGSGNIIIEYGDELGIQENSEISIRISDSEGQVITDGWYFSERPRTRALFFNLTPGIYQIHIYAGVDWIGSETVIVYSDTISSVHMGSANLLK